MPKTSASCQDLPPEDTEDQTACVFCVYQPPGFRGNFCCAAIRTAQHALTNGQCWMTTERPGSYRPPGEADPSRKCNIIIIASGYVRSRQTEHRETGLLPAFGNVVPMGLVRLRIAARLPPPEHSTTRLDALFEIFDTPRQDEILMPRLQKGIPGGDSLRDPQSAEGIS